MDKNKIIQESEKFMKNNIPRSRDKEDYLRHINGARRYAIKLARTYNADRFVVNVAALLHDVGADVGEKHAEESAKISLKFLSRFDINPILSEKIIIGKEINNRSFFSYLSRKKFPKIYFR